MNSKEKTLKKLEELKKVREELIKRKLELPGKEYDEILKWQDIYLSNAYYTNLGKGTRRIQRSYEKEKMRLCREESVCKIKIKINEIKAAITR